MRTARPALRCNALLGDARKHNHCHPLMPLAVIHRDRRRPPFGFLPIRRLWLRTLSAPLKRSPPPSSGSRPRHRAATERRRAGRLGKPGVGSQCMRSTAVRRFETMPSRVMATASRSSVRRLPLHLAIAARSSGATNQVRGANHFALQRLRGRRPTPAFSGAANGIARTHANGASRPPLQRLVRRQPHTHFGPSRWRTGASRRA